MGKDISFKNHDRFIHLGIAIAALRKMRGMSQEQLAEKRGSADRLSVLLKRRDWQRAFRWMCFSTLPTRWTLTPLT